MKSNIKNAEGIKTSINDFKLNVKAYISPAGRTSKEKSLDKEIHKTEILWRYIGRKFRFEKHIYR